MRLAFLSGSDSEPGECVRLSCISHIDELSVRRARFAGGSAILDGEETGCGRGEGSTESRLRVDIVRDEEWNNRKQVYQRAISDNIAL